jgi:hypothetical protein
MAGCPECYNLIVLGSADHDDVLTPHLFFSALSERIIHYLRCWNSTFFKKGFPPFQKKKTTVYTDTPRLSQVTLHTRLILFCSRSSSPPLERPILI